MIDLYIDTARTLSHMFYGIPFFLFNIILTLLFTFLIILPLSKIIESERFKHVQTDNPIFMKFISLPLLIGVLLTYGMTLISLLNIFDKIFNLGLF